MSKATGIRVTILDHATGQTETVEVPENEYFILCTGACHVSNTNVYPRKGTHVVTIKCRKAVAP